MERTTLITQDSQSLTVEAGKKWLVHVQPVTILSASPAPWPGEGLEQPSTQKWESVPCGE